MSEHDDELKRALAENGVCDAELARRGAVAATSYFDAQLRRHARVTFATFIVVLAVLEFAFVGFVLTFSTKALVGFAVLLVTTVVLITAVSLRHEVRGALIGLLREVKLLRLERLGLPVERAIEPARQALARSTSPWRILSRRETAAWFGGLILAAVASSQLTLWLMTAGMAMTDESRVTLAPDGAGVAVHKVSYRYQGFLPLTSASLWSGEPTYTITQWLDTEGRDLPISIETIDGQRRFTVQFAEPIMPGDRVAYTTTATWPQMATKDGETWTCRGGQKWGGAGRKYFLEAIRLPPGAEIVSVEPKPNQQSVEDGRAVLRFQAVVDEEHELSYTIKYRVRTPDTKDGRE